jgi:hypothetical protein
MAILTLLLSLSALLISPLDSIGFAMAANSRLHCSRAIFLLQTALFQQRAFDLYLEYERTAIPPGFDFRYVFVNLLPQNTTKPPNIVIPDNFLGWREAPQGGDALPGSDGWERRDSAAMFYSFLYALEDKDIGWVYRGYDDILINFELVGAYLEELERQYDPMSDFVVRGDCVVNGPLYPQGGAGMVLSRRAVELMAPMGRQAIWEFGGTYDDQNVGLVLARQNRSAGNCSSSAFLGYPFEEEQWKLIQEGDFNGLEECVQPDEWETGCRRFLLSVRQIVFYHTGKDPQGQQTPLEIRMKMARNLWSAPAEVAVSRHGNGVYLCYWKEAGRQKGTFNRA